MQADPLWASLEGMVDKNIISHATQERVNDGMALHGGDAQGLLSVPPSRLPNSAHYNRLFEYLPPYLPRAEALIELGKSNGPMDANPGGAEIPKDRLAKSIQAGFTYFGQFLDHNITFQASPDFHLGQLPQDLANTRSGRIELEPIYGLGPATQGFIFYALHDRGQLYMNPKNRRDVPRRSDGVPLIADPRNDTNVIVLQLHLAFMKFHNILANGFRNTSKVNGDQVFALARQQVAWTFQWMVLNQFLPRILESRVYEEIVQNKIQRYYRPKLNKAIIPVEFSNAAYRLHSLPTETYHLNKKKQGHLFKFRKPFSPLGDCDHGPDDNLYVDWTLFFGGSSSVQFAKKFDGTISHTFLNMPLPIDSPLEWPENTPRDHLNSIAVRNLLRGRAVGLPSGQAIARCMGLTPYSANEMGHEAIDLPETPLWYYVMKEAELECQGETLGTLGSAIVGEVLYGLINADSDSYLCQNPEWSPPDDYNTMEKLLDMVEKADGV